MRWRAAVAAVLFACALVMFFGAHPYCAFLTPDNWFFWWFYGCGGDAGGGGGSGAG